MRYYIEKPKTEKGERFIPMSVLSQKTGGKNAANPVNIYWVQTGHFTPVLPQMKAKICQNLPKKGGFLRENDKSVRYEKPVNIRVCEVFREMIRVLFVCHGITLFRIRNPR